MGADRGGGYPRSVCIEMRSGSIVLCVAFVAGCAEQIVGPHDIAGRFDRSGMVHLVDGDALVFYAPESLAGRVERADLVDTEVRVLRNLASVGALDIAPLTGVRVYLHDGDVLAGADGQADLDAVDVELLALGPSFERNLTHELVHVLTKLNFGVNHRLLLVEGAAVYISYATHSGVVDLDPAPLDDLVEATLRHNDYVGLSELSASVAWTQHPRVAYAESGAFCRELVLILGWIGFFDLYASPESWATTVDEWDEVVEARTGLPLSGFDSRIRQRAGSD